MSDTPIDYFEEWFVKPMEVLKNKVEGGSGAFIALATGIFLYERYFDSLKQAKPPRTTATTIQTQLSQDFSVSVSAATDFWNTFRNGLLHKAMPKQQGTPQYLMDGKFPNPIELTTGTPPLLKVQPWAFVERVLALWQVNIDLWDADANFPVAKRFKIEYRHSTAGPNVPPEIVLVEVP